MNLGREGREADCKWDRLQMQRKIDGKKSNEDREEGITFTVGCLLL